MAALGHPEPVVATTALAARSISDPSPARAPAAFILKQTRYSPFMIRFSGLTKAAHAFMDHGHL